MRLELNTHPAAAFSNVSIREHSVSDPQHTFSDFRQQIVDDRVKFVAYNVNMTVRRMTKHIPNTSLDAWAAVQTVLTRNYVYTIV